MNQTTSSCFNLAGLKNSDIPLTTSEVYYGPVKLSCSSCHILKKKPVRDGHPINAHSSISSHDVYFIVLFWKKKRYELVRDQPDDQYFVSLYSEHAAAS